MVPNRFCNIKISLKTTEFLTLSLSDNEFDFTKKDNTYNGLEGKDMKLTATVTSSSPYEVTALIPKFIVGEKGRLMNSESFKIKAGDQDASVPSTAKYISEYTPFKVGEKIKIIDNAQEGTDNKHDVFIKLKSKSAQKADAYVALIKFEAKQK